MVYQNLQSYNKNLSHVLIVDSVIFNARFHGIRGNAFVRQDVSKVSNLSSCEMTFEKMSRQVTSSKSKKYLGEVSEMFRKRSGEDDDVVDVDKTRNPSESREYCSHQTLEN